MLLEDIFSKSANQLNIKPTQKIAVAVSGGADSMALSLLAKNWSKAQIIAITVDHKLRDESKDEAEQVSRWMEKHKIQHHILNWNGEKPISNIQANARKARYEIMTEFCKLNRIKTLLIAHNKEDQAETILIRLMRGSGLEGLCGISPNTIINDVRIVRPLLDVNKNDLKSYLRKKRQGWIEDPSNQNEKFKRVQVRNFINSSNEPDLLVERLANTCNVLKQSYNFIEEMVLKDMKRTLLIQPEGYCIIDIEIFKSLNKESAVNILSKTIKLIGGEYYKPRFEKTELLYKQIMNNKYSATLGGCEIFKSKKKKEEGKLFIIKENAALQNPLRIKNQASVIWDGRFRCTLDNNNSDGYYVGAITEKGFNNILKKDKHLQKINLPKKIIFTLPALQTLENIVAAPHIGYYENDGFKNKFKTTLLNY